MTDNGFTPLDEILWNKFEDIQQDVASRQANGGVCDFCEAQPITHFVLTVPQNDMQMIQGDTLIGHVNDADGGWACCVDCAPIVATMDVELLTNHVMARLNLDSQHLAMMLAATYLGLFERMRLTQSKVRPVSEAPPWLTRQLNRQ